MRPGHAHDHSRGKSRNGWKNESSIKFAFKISNFKSLRVSQEKYKKESGMILSQTSRNLRSFCLIDKIDKIDV